MPKRGGWWVKAAANPVTPAAARPPRCLHKTGQAQVRSHCIGESRVDPIQMPARRSQTKKSPRASPRIKSRGSPRSKRSSQTEEAQPEHSLTGLVGETPISKLLPPTVGPNTHPVAAKSDFGGVASCDPTQYQFLFQEKSVRLAKFSKDSCAPSVFLFRYVRDVPP
jgi:hypothetical protein